MSYLQTQAQKLQPTATPPAAATTWWLGRAESSWNVDSPKPHSQPKVITNTNYLVNKSLTNGSITLSNPSTHSQSPPPKRTKRTLRQYSPGELG